MDLNWPMHGANPQYIYEKTNLEMPVGAIDFSANINPLGPPPVLLRKWFDLFQTVQLYPDPFASRLKEKISNQYGIPSKQLLIGNGAAEIISLLGRILAGKKVLLLQPAFSEYEEVCRINNCDIYHHYLSEETGWELSLAKLEKDIRQVDAVFLCNPNNPTGIFYPKNLVEELLDICMQNDCSVILDEAFYDFVVGYEDMLPLLKNYPNLIILRSLTKMYSIPGIRLGYVFASEELITQLQHLQSQWSINGIALKAGELLIEQEEFLNNTQSYIEGEKKKLFSFFKNKHFVYSNSAANYYLLKDPRLTDQKEFLTFLLNNGIIARHTYNYPSLEGRWLRFAVKSKEQNQQLRGVLTKWKQNHPSSL